MSNAEQNYRIPIDFTTKIGSILISVTPERIRVGHTPWKTAKGKKHKPMSEAEKLRRRRKRAENKGLDPDAYLSKRRAFTKKRKLFDYSNWMRRAYGMSIAQYLHLIHSQNECCAICKEPLTTAKRGRHIDHDHKNGAVRGILCRQCNLGLGSFFDDPQRLIRAAGYILMSSRGR